MDQPSRERLMSYLAQLAPGTRALLMRECERALATGEDAIAALVLDELRRAVRGDDNERSRGVAARRQVFRPLEPFLVDGGATTCPGRIRRSALEAVWQWLAQEALPEPTRALEAALAVAVGCAPAQILDVLRAYRLDAGRAIADVLAGGHRDDRLPLRLAAPRVAEDLAAIGATLAAHEELEIFAARLPGAAAVFGPVQIGAVLAGLDTPALAAPLLLPFALGLVASRLAAPWQIVRLAIHVAGSDDETRVATVPHGVAVTMALNELARVGAALRADVRRGRYQEAGERLKILHDGVRGLRSELDLRAETTWGRQLAGIRRDIAAALHGEIDAVPGRVRRLLRPRADRDISPSTRLDPIEIDQTAALVGLVTACRAYAGELAVSEVTQRVFTELRQDVERATTALVEQVKTGDGRARGFRRDQLAVAVRFCAPLFGADFAALMARAAEHAVPMPVPVVRSA